MPKNTEQDWTTSEEGRANSSPLFNELVRQVAGIVRDSAHSLLQGHTESVARLIMAHLAHVHGMVPRDTRPLAGYFRGGADNWAEWSIPMDVNEDGKPYRLFVRLDDLIEIFESPVTSTAPTARELGHAQKLELTSDEAEWLSRVLPLALARKERG